MENNALLQFMHDTMGDTARIKGSIALLKKNPGMPEIEKNILLKAIEDSSDHLDKVLDQYYIDNKEK